jgi:hypothetical protein
VWMCDCLVVVSSSRFDRSVCVHSRGCPASPFIASKGRARVTFVVRGEIKRKITKVASGWPSSSLSGGNSSPIAQRCNRR